MVSVKETAHTEHLANTLPEIDSSPSILLGDNISSPPFARSFNFKELAHTGNDFQLI